MAVLEKKCSGPCGQTLHRDHFYVRNQRKRTGLSSRCKDCCRIARTAAARTPEGRAKLAHYYKTKGRYEQVKIKYGLSREEYDAMLGRANGKCECCGTPFRTDTKRREPAVDHCHATGKVRGLLCIFCNRMFGLARDQVEILSKGIVYLKERG